MKSKTFSDSLKTGVRIFLWSIKSNRALIIIYLSVLAFFGILNTTLIMGVKAYDHPSLIKTALDFMLVETYLTSMIVGFVAAIREYSYLHSKRKTDFFGSLPVSRRTVFFSKTLAVIFISAVPALVVTIASSIMSGVFSFNFDWYIRSLALLISSAAFFGLLSVCCGKTSDKIVSFFIIGIGYPLTLVFLNLLPLSLLWGYVPEKSIVNDVLFTLTPFRGLFDGPSVLWFVFPILCFAASFALLKRRKAECAQSGFAFRFPLYISKVLVSLSFGFVTGFAFVMTEIFGSNEYLSFWLGMITGSLTAYVIFQIVFAHGMKGFFKSLILYGTTIGCAALLFSFLASGWFGYETYVPRTEDVKSISFTDKLDTGVFGDYIIKCESEDRDVIEKAVKSHREDVAEKIEFKRRSMKRNLIEKILNMNFNAAYLYVDAEIEAAPYVYSVTYTLKNGARVSRSYFDSFVEQPDRDRVFPSFAYSDEYRENYYPLFVCDEKYVTDITITDDITEDEGIIVRDYEKCRQIVRTFKEEYDKYGFVSSGDYTIKIDYGEKDGDDAYLVTQMILSVPDEYKKTLKLVKNEYVESSIKKQG